MAADTIPGVSVRILDECAQALWAAMADDDGLANDYVDLCIVHGLTHFVNGGLIMHLTADQQWRLVHNLEDARRKCKAVEAEMAERWSSYGEPPF